MGIIANVFNKFINKYRPFLMSNGEYVPTGTLRDNEIVGAVADAIGKNVGRLRPQMTRENHYLFRLLSIRPCPELSTYDFLYRIATDLVYTSNSFSVIFWNDDFTKIISIQPIVTNAYRIFLDERNNILFSFRWNYDGGWHTVPYQCVIHIKARFNKHRFMGTSPDIELKRNLELVETTGEMIKNVAKRSNMLAGYIKYNNIADDEELTKIAKNFRDSYYNADNAGGIASLDNTYEFKELAQRPPMVPVTLISFLRDNVYRYYGVNEKILTSTLNHQEWISFHENVIEPIAIQLSYEFTYKLLTASEIGHGNKIEFTANLLQYATLEKRNTIGGNMLDRGALTINEYRALMFYPPVEGGDERLVSLNYVKATDQTLYQTGQENNNSGDAEESEGD
ncbi:MAG: phage portal protein [Lachnospiraceae bacterium]|nr:phage portal protein [Lachnospiraceae bacterium]